MAFYGLCLFFRVFFFYKCMYMILYYTKRWKGKSVSVAQRDCAVVWVKYLFEHYIHQFNLFVSYMCFIRRFEWGNVVKTKTYSERIYPDVPSYEFTVSKDFNQTVFDWNQSVFLVYFIYSLHSDSWVLTLEFGTLSSEYDIHLYVLSRF